LQKFKHIYMWKKLHIISSANKPARKNKTGHWGRCRVVSEVVYATCKLLHLKGNFKINIIQHLRGDDICERGHAWVTCNDKDLFLTPAHRPQSLDKIGENDKYCYWVCVRQGRLQHAHEKYPNA